MTPLATPADPSTRAALTPTDLAELIDAFNDVTARLQRTHEHLSREVASLRRRLDQANAELDRSRRLAALGEMAAGIAHEVRNPLASIRLYAGILEQELEDRPESRATARRIVEGVRRLDAVVSDVLAFAREARVQRAPIDLDALVARAMESALARGRADGSIAQVETSADGGGLVVTGDPALLHQALVNVVQNALDAMVEASPTRTPRVAVAATRVRDDGRDWIVLRVDDCGPGVADDVVERMFNPFFTTRESGTGLGLAIVHRIIDAHGGRVRVRSRAPGEGGPGATVELWLPEVREAGGREAA